jgi:hypothetical protein
VRGSRRRELGRVWIGRLTLVAVCGLALAVAVDVLVRGGDTPVVIEHTAAPALSGPDVPQPGTLDGTLYVAAGPDCRLQALDLATVTLGQPGPRTACGLWAAPHGPFAAVTRSRESGSTDLWLARLGNPPELIRRLGRITGDPTWSADGSELAWCEGGGSTVVVGVESGGTRSVHGCRPVLTPGGLLTRPDQPLASTLLLDGRRALDAAELAQAFHGSGPVDVLGFDQRADGLVAVAVVSFGGTLPEAKLGLWRHRALVGTIAFPLFVIPGDGGVLGERVRFAPSGTEVAIGFAGASFELTVAEVGSSRLTLEPSRTRAWTWSPDGVWLARASEGAIRVAGPERSETVYVLPVDARALAWR